MPSEYSAGTKLNAVLPFIVWTEKPLVFYNFPPTCLYLFYEMNRTQKKFYHFLADSLDLSLDGISSHHMSSLVNKLLEIIYSGGHIKFIYFLFNVPPPAESGQPAQ